MAHLLIWGTARDILSGGVTPGAKPQHVSSFAALKQAADGHDATLVLADAACLESEREAVLAWRKAGGAPHALLVAVAKPEDADAVAGRLAFVDEVELGPVTPARLRLKLERAVELVHSRRAIRQLESALGRKGEELSVLNRIGVALSAERDIEKLLELILSKSREITDADAGSLYLVQRKADGEGHELLSFELAQNDTVVRTLSSRKRGLPSVRARRSRFKDSSPASPPSRVSSSAVAFSGARGSSRSWR